MSTLSEIKMRKAIEIRDKSFDGVFFFGVITTGVFCQPSCSAKAAKAENIRLFSNIEAAMVAGFRPCKRCHPIQGISRVERLIEVVRYIETHADEKITLSSLSEIAALSPSRLQKVFKETFGISPKVYQDAIRMDLFKHSLKEGESVTNAIYSAGFGSISRVYGESSRHLGMNPKIYCTGGAGEVISYAFRHTNIGLMMMGATDKGVCFVQFDDNEDVLLSQLEVEFPKATLIISTSQNAPELDLWIEALNQHISQGVPRPDLPLDIRGTVFQIKVWHFLLSIKEGDTVSYAEVAEKIGNPKAARAIGTACGKNTIGVLIPCHRVLRGDGQLGGYRWGLDRKQILLDKERGGAKILTKLAK